WEVQAGPQAVARVGATGVAIELCHAKAVPLVAEAARVGIADDEAGDAANDRERMRFLAGQAAGVDRVEIRARIQASGADRTALGVLMPLPAAGGAQAGDGHWPTYHHSGDRAGVAAVGSSFNGVQQAWATGGLGGAVYAEPLYVGGRVLVATENNTIYAIDASSGGPIWQTHLADPVDSGSLPCGNIRPNVGITGTPVVDTGSGVLYAAAMVRP